MSETDVQGDRDPEVRLEQGDREPEVRPEQGADELEARIDHLGDDIDDARRQLRARQEDADIGGDVAGDWEDTDDHTGGEDPAAFDDPETDEEDEDEY